jgi:hypothetical protein
VAAFRFNRLGDRPVRKRRKDILVKFTMMAQNAIAKTKGTDGGHRHLPCFLVSHFKYIMYFGTTI